MKIVIDAFKDYFSNIYNKMEDKTKKLILISTVAIIIFIIIIAILVKISGNRIDYYELESRLEVAATNYYKVHKDKLPKKTNQSVKVKATTLQKEDVDNDEEPYIKDIKKLVKDESCSGYVKVTKTSKNKYKYQPFVDCDDFKTEFFVTRYLEKNPIKKDGSFQSGLYEVNDELITKGDVDINNYVKFADKLWRLMKFDKDKNFYLILDSIDEDKTYVWDDRYNIIEDSNQGINDYTKSRIYTSLINLYNGNKLFSKEQKKFLVPFDVCIDKVSPTKSYNKTCNTTLNDQYISLLTVMDFLNSSLDSGCTAITQEQCRNYNYLSMKEDFHWWLLNANEENTYEAFEVTGLGYGEFADVSDIANLRYVIKINKDVLYEKGKGTENNPYILR